MWRRLATFEEYPGYNWSKAMIVFAWSGFPQYAARCVGAFVKALGNRTNVMVVATRPRVPIQGMEQLCGCPIRWVDASSKIEGLPKIEHLFVSGWGIRAFNDLRDSVKANGGKVYVMVDNNLEVGFWRLCRELIKAIKFRIALRNKYDGFFVPGKSGLRLLSLYGAPKDKIRTGMYSADSSLFKSEVPICDRPRRIIYVGQICERKNVKRLVESFIQLWDNGAAEGWALELYGCGPLEEDIRALAKDYKSAVRIHPFQQPEKLAELYGSSRIFILPSKEEHWGLVVHEAALSGCVLLLSKQVGAAEDFLSCENGKLFDPNSTRGITAALRWAMHMDDAAMMRASACSIRESKSMSLHKFVSGVFGVMG